MNLLIIGAFDFVTFDSGGQPVKTRELYYALRDYYGEHSVDYFETVSWKKSFVPKLLDLFQKVRRADVIILLPAHNGVRLLSPLVYYIKKKKTKIFYDVVGGWLPSMLNSHHRLASILRQYHGLWVETSSMLEGLTELGFKNVSVVKNFKHLKTLSYSDLQTSFTMPYRLCTFSRVVENKGIEDAVRAVVDINQKRGEVVFVLDIYGPIDENYEQDFSGLIKTAPDYVKYKGEKKPNESVDVLRDYFALLFPTKFYTEGIPGTIIDAYSAGIPVISSLWLNASDVFIDGFTGFGFEFGNYDSFVNILDNIAINPSLIIGLKKNCLDFAENFSPVAVMSQISKLIED